MSVVTYGFRPAPEAGKLPLTWTVDNNDIRQQQVALFNRMCPNLKLSVDDSNREMAKVVVQSLGGVGPDLFESKTGFALSGYVNAGIALDLTDEIKKLGVDIERDLWNGANSCLIYEGRIYGLPNNVAVDALWFNKAIFEEAKLPYPAGPMAWDQFLPTAEKLTERTADGKVTRFGFLFEWWQWPMFMRQWNGRVYSADGTRCEIDCAETIAAIQFMHDLIYRYNVAPTPDQESAMATQGGWGTGAISWFGSGRAATGLGGRWWLIALRRYDGLRLGACESPHGTTRLFHSYGRATLVNRRSPHRKEALEFMRFILSQQYNELLNHQGDGIGPVKSYSMTEKFMTDPPYDHNGVWRDIMKYAVPEQICPFVNGGTVDLIINNQLDLVKADQKTAAAAMRDARIEIDAEIQKTIKADAKLRANYDALVRAGRNN